MRPGEVTVPWHGLATTVTPIRPREILKNRRSITAQLASEEAERLRSAAERNRANVRKTLVDAFEIGRELLGLKDSRPHGQFGSWIRTEFDWGKHNARNSPICVNRGKTQDGSAAFIPGAPTQPLLGGRGAMRSV